jgi:hypothetical protein
MHTNHRRASATKRQGRKRGHYGPVGALKEEARAGRRSNERSLMGAIRSGAIEPDEATFWTKNAHVSDMWNHD